MAKITGKSIIVPVCLIVFYILLLLFLRNIFPTGKSLIDYFAAIYGRFGYEIVIVGSLLEALIVINFFIPGVAAVGLGIIFAKAGELDLTLAIILAVTGALIGYILDFFLGRFGFGELLSRMGYKGAIEKTRSEIEKSGLKTFSLGFIHPNIGSLVALTAGTLQMKFSVFLILSLLSTMVWYILWGLLIFALGEIFLIILTKYVWLLLLLVVSIWTLISLYGKKKNVHL